jgi:hypothetical protein
VFPVDTLNEWNWNAPRHTLIECRLARGSFLRSVGLELTPSTALHVLGGPANPGRKVTLGTSSATPQNLKSFGPAADAHRPRSLKARATRTMQGATASGRPCRQGVRDLRTGHFPLEYFGADLVISVSLIVDPSQQIPPPIQLDLPGAGMRTTPRRRTIRFRTRTGASPIGLRNHQKSLAQMIGCELVACARAAPFARNYQSWRQRQA